MKAPFCFQFVTRLQSFAWNNSPVNAFQNSLDALLLPNANAICENVHPQLPYIFHSAHNKIAQDNQLMEIKFGNVLRNMTRHAAVDPASFWFFLPDCLLDFFWWKIQWSFQMIFPLEASGKSDIFQWYLPANLTLEVQVSGRRPRGSSWELP